MITILEKKKETKTIVKRGRSGGDATNSFCSLFKGPWFMV